PRRYLHEPERWLAVHSNPTQNKVSIARIFKPDLRRVTIVGTLIGVAMMVGSWGGLTWIPSWTNQLLTPELAAHSSTYVSYVLMLLNGGAILGYITLMWLTEAVGRRWSYFIFCAGGLLSSLCLFATIHSYTSLCLFIPIYGYFAVGGFGTFAVYLPELFPTVVRATGQGFCWNIARFFTGFGPLAGGVLVISLGSFPAAIAVIALVFILGLVSIWFVPETKGIPLRDY
ncbi:MAG: MFS transporter, partial [Ktedonobacteraceae bacterium]